MIPLFPAEPAKHSFVRRHKFAVGAAAIGALFVVLPKEHRGTLAAILGCIALAAAVLVAAVLVAGITTEPETWTPPPATTPATATPTPAEAPSVWCTVSPNTFC